MPVWRATFSGMLWGNTVQNVCHFSWEGQAPELCDYLDTNWIDRIKTFQHNQFTWLDIGVRDVTSVPANAAFHKPINKIGTSSLATATDTNLVTVVLQLRTNFAGRSGRGRICIGGVPSGRFNLGLVEPSVLTIWQATADALRDAFFAGQTCVLGVTSRSNPANIKGVVTIQVRQAQGTMRSRGYGRGI